MEKRNFIRVDFPECASIKYENQMFFANIKDMSLQGLFISTSQNVPIHTPLQVTVYVSHSASIYLNVDVVRCNSEGVGVQIREMDVNSFIHLRRAITAKCSNHELVMQETFKIANRVH